jgi:hypothetical protein
MRFGVVVLAMAGVLATAAARANDTSSELALGGLRFVKTSEIAIEREDLSLSPKEVRVRYEMRNLTDHPVKLHVAFPLPAVPVETPGGYLLFDDQGREVGRSLQLFDRIGHGNFLDFRVWAAGRPIWPEVDVHALLPDGRDVTLAMHDIGGMDLLLRPRLLTSEPLPAVPPDPNDSDVGPSILQQLEALGAVDPGSVRAKEGLALWRALVTFHWDAIFTPGVTVIEHRYRPIVGFRYQGFAADGYAAEQRVAAIANYCIAPDETTRLDMLAERAGPAGPGVFPAMTLGYVLTTGANWAGPIRHFHLEIIGEDVTFGTSMLDTIELCAEFAVRRAALGRIEADVEDFTPTRDIHVLLLRTEDSHTSPPSLAR